MFIQLIQGKVGDADGLQKCLDRWDTELKPGVTGYLGTTYGTTDDGMLVALARFDSAESARRNSDRPEQGEWWAETEKCFDGEVTFMDCPNVKEWLGGGSDDAGFVQIMEGHSTNIARMNEILDLTADRVHEGRPEIIGAVLCSDDGDSYVEAVYFTSEAEAREAEKMEIPDDIRSLFEEEMQLAGDITYYDLHQPHLVSA